MPSLTTQIQSARRVSVPLLAINTADPAATLRLLVDEYGEKYPLIRWDIAGGFQGLNADGQAAVAEITGGMEPAMFTNPVDALLAAARLPSGPETKRTRPLLAILNAQRLVENESVVQAIWNLRDPFKSDGRTLVLLGQGLQLPPELAQDVLSLDQPLPDEFELQRLVQEVYEAARFPAPTPEQVTRAVDATVGLPAYAAETALAMTVQPASQSIDTAATWDWKGRIIGQQQGTEIYRGGETFDDIAGLGNLKEFLTLVKNGRSRPRVVAWFDEIEKSIGTGLDTSGVSQALLGYLLTWMQDSGALGIILVGPPGSGKSAIAKAAGSPTIKVDLAGMKSSLVGESERNLRKATATIDAVSQGRTLVIATCNGIANLPPELRRRFNLGTFFVDLPDATERAGIWGLYVEKYFPEEVAERLAEVERLNDEGWTGAEIRQCVDLAWRLDTSLIHAATYVVPVAVAARDQIEKLRTEAHGRYLSASNPGLYDKPSPLAPGQRRLMEVS